MVKSYVRRLFTSKGFIAFTFGFVMYLLVMLPQMLDNSGIVMFGGDYNQQSIPFTYHIRDVLLTGDIGWDWQSGLGNDFITNYAYYGVFSPFTALYLLVPKNLLIYSITIISALKYGVGTLLAYIYIKRFVTNPHYAVIGGIVYMFSSFMGYNLVFHFSDVCALFPLLLIALESLVNEKRRGFFAVAVAIMALTNYYFFFGQAVFVVIYYFVRGTDKSFGFSLRHFGAVLLEALIGVSIAMIVLLPVILFLTGLEKSTALISTSDMLLYDNIYYYLHIIQSFFMVPDGFCFVSLFPTDTTLYPHGAIGASVAGYIPLFSFAGVISFCVARKRTWEKYILIICMITALVPVLNQVFSAFNSSYYARWYYMFILISSMVSVKALEEKISFKPGIITCGAALGAMIIYQIVVDTDKIISRSCFRATLNMPQNILHFAITAVCLVILIIVVRSKRDKEYISKLYIFTAISVYMVFGIMAYHLISSITDIDVSTAKYNLDGDISQYVNENERISNLNYNLVWGCESTSFFCSTYDLGYVNFLNESGLRYDDGTYKPIEINSREISDLTSVKYFFILGETDKTNVECIGKWGIYYVYENLNYIPMGFTLDSVMSYDTFSNIDDNSIKQQIYMRSLIVDDTDVFADILPIDNSCETISAEEYQELVERRQSEVAYYLEKNSSGLVSRINLEKENVVLYSTSFNKSWKAYVDGTEVPVYKVDNGLIGIRVPSGDHEVALHYKTEGLTEGAIISLAGIAVLVAYIFISRRLKKKPTEITE